MRLVFVRSTAAAVGLLCVSAAVCADPVDEVRAQLAMLRAEYEGRIAALEARLAEVQNNQQTPPPASASAQGGALSNAFNPALSVILDGKFTSYRRNPDAYALPGFQLGSEAGLEREGFGVGESEIVAASNVDSYLYGQLTAALHQEHDETHVDVEEAFFDTLSLPQGFTLRGGRFYSGIGYSNSRHAHTWNFADTSLAQRAFLGNNFSDDGLQLRWLAPTPFLLELGGEVLRGDSFPAGGGANDGVGAHSAFLRVGTDIGVSHSVRLGASRLWADPRERTGGDAHDTAFFGDSTLSIADLVWKWAPQGNPVYRNASFIAEFYNRDENGDLRLDELGVPAFSTYRGRQRGAYTEAVYQFRPRWRVGLRHDRLWADNSGSDPELLADVGLLDGHDPRRSSVMLDYNPSEFSRFRVQYNRDWSRPRVDDQWILQYVLSLGSHGAHSY